MTLQRIVSIGIGPIFRITCILLAIVSLAAAQSIDVTLNGTVRDESGGMIPGATVTASNIKTGLERTAITDEAGLYTILSVSPGTYNVKCEVPGFATVVRNDQNFSVGTTITIDFKMQIASIAETIEVQGEAPIIETTKSNLSRIIDVKELDDLPVVGRSFSDLAALAPGVQTTSGGSIMIGNSFSYQTGYRVDGISTKSADGRVQGIDFAQDWIEEFSVITQQFPAEFGEASGGVVNAITRSGTNEVHGRAYAYIQNDSMNATPALTTIKPPYDQERIGGMIGGPLVKEKLFYFGGVERYKLDTSNIVASSFPEYNGPYPAENKTWLALLRLDYQPTSNHKLHVRGNLQRDVGLGQRIGGRNTPEYGTQQYNWLYLYGANWTYLVSPNTINELRVAFSKTDTNTVCYYALDHPEGGWFNVNYPGANFRCAGMYGGNGERYFQLNETVTMVRGKHEIRFGGHIARPKWWSGKYNNTEGTYGFDKDILFSFDDPETYPSRFTQNIGLVFYDLPAVNFGAFVQDSWKVNPSLTLNFGVRYDIDGSAAAVNDYVPYEKGFQAIETDYKKVAPRFGFAWRPFGAASDTVIRGGTSISYDTGKLQIGNIYMTLTAGIEKQISVNANSSLLNPFWPDRDQLRLILATAFAANTVPATSDFPANVGTAYNMDSDITIPGTWQSTLGVTHNFSDRFNVSVDFANIEGFDQFIMRDVNLDPVTYERLNPLFSNILTWHNAGWFTSRSLMVKTDFRSHRGDTVRVAYTLASARGNTTGPLYSRSAPATNPFDYSEDEGSNDNDIRHVLSVSGTWWLPFRIQFSPLITFRSAFPYSATTRFDPNPADPFINRPEPRNSRRGDNYFTFDARLGKSVMFSDRYSISAFIEGFNLTNTTNFTSYVGSMESSLFGRPTRAAAKRRLQIGFRFDF